MISLYGALTAITILSAADDVIAHVECHQRAGDKYAICQSVPGPITGYGCEEGDVLFFDRESEDSSERGYCLDADAIGSEKTPSQ